MGLLCRRFPPNLQMNGIDRNKWSLLEPLLDQVLDLAPEERTRWLAELSGRSPELANEGEPLDHQVLAGWIALARGDHDSAKRLFMTGLRSNGYYEGKARMLLEPVVFGLARCHLALGEPAEALKLAREARATASVDSLAEFRSARVGEARLIEARALLASGDSAGGRASIERAVVALATGAGMKHPLTGEARALAATLGAPVSDGVVKQ
jgi:hypothetical protein